MSNQALLAVVVAAIAVVAAVAVEAIVLWAVGERQLCLQDWVVEGIEVVAVVPAIELRLVADRIEEFRLELELEASQRVGCHQRQVDRPCSAAVEGNLLVVESKPVQRTRRLALSKWQLQLHKRRSNAKHRQC